MAVSEKKLEQRMKLFAKRCGQRGLAATHQRYVIYRALAESEDHPSPEAVYEKVKEHIPSISPATVYKNIKTFVSLGLLQEVTPIHETNRLDANLDHHHHLVCVRCKSVSDYSDEQLDSAVAATPNPKGFKVFRYQVEALGLCPACQLELKHQSKQRGRRRAANG